MTDEAQSAGSREKILEVAEALFARRGFAGVGLREVAETAGLGKSSLFHHFRSKVQLYFDVLGRALGRIEARLLPTLAGGGEPMARLDRAVDTMIDSLAEQPATARLLLRSIFEDDDFAPDPIPEAEPAERALEAMIAGLEALLRDGVTCGAFRPVSARHMVQTLIGATVYHFASGDFGEQLVGGSLFSADEVRRRKDEVKSLLHYGLAATAPVPTGG